MKDCFINAGLGFVFTLAIMASGCSPKIVKGPMYKNGKVSFKFDSDVVSPQYDKILERGLAYLKTYSKAVLILEGHTDAVGSDIYNRDLGDKRARAVKAYLLANGIDPERLITVSYGESKADRDAVKSRVVLLKEATR
jgi:outer membrane protein OmpA-like peptidoglycan-associated protein